jgi:nucleotide-binding universal stress UspA family protein
MPKKKEIIAMYLRIVVPLDGSELAEQVLPYVRLLGKTLSVPIDLLRVVDPSFSYMADFTNVLRSEQTDSPMVRHAEGYLERIIASLREEGLRASGAVFKVYGDTAASQILSEAEKEPATLIVMSTHGRSGVARWTLGSVTDKVLHTTSNPLMIIRARGQGIPLAEAKMHKVIIPLDGSFLSEQVVPYVIPLVKALGLDVSLVRALECPVSVNSHVFQAMDYLEEVADKLRQQGIPSVEKRLIFGHPPSVIEDLVEEDLDSLVAMTSNVRSGLGRWVLGSVTDRVVRHSPAPVLVIRATREEIK